MTTSGIQETSDGIEHRLGLRSEELEERINSFEERLKAATEETRGSFRPVAERLRNSWQILRSSLERLGSAPGETREALVRDIERGLAQLESEVAVVRADLETELAETRQSYREAVRQQLDAWRGRVEHLRVQAALAEMEARDELDELLARVDNAYRAARQQLVKADEDTAETLDVLRASARRVLNDLEMAMDAARRRFIADRTA